MLNDGICSEQSSEGPMPELDSVFAQSKSYFELPLSEKAKAPNNDPNINRGYSGMGIEKTTNVFDADGIATLRKQEPDIKESLEIGSEPGDYPVKKEMNIWPEGLEGFKEKMIWFYKRCDDLHHVLLGAIAEGLGIEKDFFRSIKNGDHVLRLLHYPSVERNELDKEGAVRTGSHTDYGSDLLQISTNDVLESTHHRVRTPTKIPVTADGKYAARYSIAYFCHPDQESTIDTIETCWDPVNNPKKYGPVVLGEWIANRLKISY
ncbi:uncharacterized protein PAC_05461 [Phialocephala subalpina]|uniref:Non-haem dioxygenase N-terminal domain-containing protein n=1 Tax=Phialocephala subalpina TaxID=576137 RepID=A0A1L7WS35_9HELO|nr:uncharacterized protein PAC_05461 [Phialocephala subalpina]